MQKIILTSSLCAHVYLQYCFGLDMVFCTGHVCIYPLRQHSPVGVLNGGFEWFKYQQVVARGRREFSKIRANWPGFHTLTKVSRLTTSSAFIE